MAYSLTSPVNFGNLGFPSLKLHDNCSPVAFLACIPFVPVVCITVWVLLALSLLPCVTPPFGLVGLEVWIMSPGLLCFVPLVPGVFWLISSTLPLVGSLGTEVIWIMLLSLSLFVLCKGVLVACIAEIPSLPATCIVSLLETPFPSISTFPFPPGGGGTWVNFCWVCAAGLSKPLPH